jgi:hypothetical protein
LIFFKGEAIRKRDVHEENAEEKEKGSSTSGRNME